MKLKRDEFKALLKECILELIQEGKFFNGPAASLRGAPVSQASLNEQLIGDEPEVTPNARLNEAVKSTVMQITGGDPKKASLFESIVADTARTTLQAQLAAGYQPGTGLNMGVPVSQEERAFDQASLDVFQGRHMWAKLALGGKAKSGNGS